MEDDFREGPVKVREKVYKAALLVEELSRCAGMNVDHDIPGIMRDFCRDREGLEGVADFWKEVHDFLYTMTCVGRDTHIDVLPDGE